MGTQATGQKKKRQSAAIDLELMFRKNEKNRWGTGDISSSANHEQARVQKGTDKKPPKIYQAPRNVK